MDLMDISTQKENKSREIDKVTLKIFCFGADLNGESEFSCPVIFGILSQSVGILTTNAW